MSRKIYFSLIAFVLTMAATVAFVIGHNVAGASPANSAAAALPASDFIVSIDVQRALNETLPSVLAGKPDLLAKFNAHLDEFQQKTGINPRVFESLAIGGNLNPSAGLNHRDDKTVVIARGSFNSTDLLNAGFAAAKKEADFQKEEQQYEGRTIYLISQVKSLKKEADKDAADVTDQSSVRIEKSFSGSDKIAITALDANTIAVGSIESVRAAIDASLGRNRVDDELVRLASQTPNAVISFSGRVPQGMAEKATAGNPVGKYFASIHEFYGSFSASGSDAETFIALRTEKAEQASEISQAMNSMKALVGLGFTQSGGNSAQTNALSDLLKNVSITTQGNEVQISMKFQPASFMSLVHHF